eukprot:jgi/Chrpa1/23019/Chrysochromulina_OHIO_Genome00025065-RA
MGDIECAFYRSWHTVRNVWYLIFFLVAMLMALVGHAVRNDRRQMHDTLALLSGKKSEEQRRRQAKLNTSMEKRTLRRRQMAAPGAHVATRSSSTQKATDLKSRRSMGSMGSLSSQMRAPKVVAVSASATASPPPSPTEYVVDVSEEVKTVSTTTTTIVTTITEELRETTTSTTKTSRPAGLLADLLAGAGALPASADDLAAAPSAATASVVATLRVGAKPTGLQRWKQAKHKTNATLLTKRWHKDVDRVWKRLFLACMFNHSLCAGITTRGVPGFTRAQTVMILVNGFAFELVMLLLLLPAPPPLLTDNVTGMPIEPEGPLVINPIGIIFGAGVAASICIPMGLILTWLFDPIIIVNVSKNMAWLRDKCKRRSAKVAEHSDEDPASKYAVASPPVSAKVKKTFARFDVNHSGYLEIQELRKALEHHGLNLSTAEAGRILSVYDDKPNGKLDLSEFAQVIHDLSAANEAPKVKQTFARFDANDSGYLEIQELRKALEHHGLNLSTAEAGRIMSSYDDKPNGK